jgi:hypothetical protein
MPSGNVTTNVTRRSPKTKTISSKNDVRWHFSYAEPSDAADKKVKEVAQILYRFGAEHRFFASKKTAPISKPA